MGIGTTVIGCICLGIWLGHRFHNVVAGIFLGFAAALLFLFSATRETLK